MKYLSSISSDNCDVTFVNGTFTGDLTVDTNTLYVDSTNNRVGIGTTSTAYILDVTSSEWTQARFKATGSGYAPASILLEATQADSRGQGIFYYNTSGDQNWFAGVPYSTSSDDWIIGYKTGDASFNSNVAQQSYALVNLTSSGNFGIGTTSPISKLDVTGAGYFSGESLSSGLDQTYTNIALLIDEGDYIYTKDSSTTLRKLIGKASDVIYIGQSGTSLIDGIVLQPGTTNGYVSFYDDNSEYARFQGGNVGIGTANPKTSLDIVKDTDIWHFMVGGATKKLLIGGQATNGDVVLQAGAASTLNNEAPTTTYNLTLQRDGGNVGIGTASPSFALHVSSGATNQVARFVSSDNNASVSIKDNDTTIYVGAESSLAYIGLTNGASVNNLIVNSNGNVGIGTTSPSEKLHVVGNGIFHSGANLGRIKVGRSADQEIEIYVDDTNNIITAYQDSDGNSSHVFALNREFDGSGANYFEIRKDGSAQMHIDTDGNVGIGTTAPYTKLDVRTSTVTGVSLPTFGQAAHSGIHIVPEGSATTEAWYGITFGNTASTASERERTTAGIFTSASGSYGNKLYFATSNSWATGAVSRMMIDHNGNVGIGTTSPTQKLHVYSATGRDFKVNQSTANVTVLENDYELEMRSNNGYDLKLNANGSSTFGSVALRTNGSEVMRASSNGNVGIGTTSPATKLEVVGSNAVRIHDGTDNGSIFFRGDRDDVYIKESNYQLLFGAPSGMVFELDTNNNNGDFFNVTHRGSSIFYINGATGNVGIGTTSPASNLHVENDGSSFSIFENTSGTNQRVDVGTNSANQHFVYGYGAYPLLFGTNGATRMTITSSGNVGIGTTSPATTLDVNGSIRVTGRSVPASGKGLELFYYSPSDLFYLEAYDYTNFLYKDIRYAALSHQFITGNVGIGTATPAQKLSVYGNIYQRTGDFITWNNGDAQIGAVSGYNLAFSTYDGSTAMVERLRITSSGNVGIGTTSPDSQLEVYYENAGNTGAQIKLGSGDIGYETTITNYRRTTGSTFEVASYDDTILGYSRATDKTWLGIGSNVGIGTTSPGAKLEVASSGADGILISKDAATTSNSGRLFFETDTVSEGFSFLNSNGQMTIRSQAQAGATSGNIRVAINGNGNVGIGTTNPGAKLDVVATNSTLAISYGNTVPNNPLHTNYYGGYTGIGMDSATAGVRIVGDTNTLVMDAGYYTSQTLQHANWNSLLRVLTNGNVGIGTTNPTTKLYVDAGESTFNRGNSDGAIARFRGKNAEQAVIGTVTSWFDSNVGIGTTSPSQKLQVAGSIYSSGNIRIEDTGDRLEFSNGNVFISRNGNELYLAGYSGWRFYDTQGQSTRVFITNGGNVGIGTTTPSAKLELNESSTSYTPAVLITNDTGNQVKLGVVRSLAGTAPNTALFEYDSDLRFIAGAGTTNEVMRITDGGNVGIGTTSPGSPLDVQSSENVLITATSTDAGAKIKLSDPDSNVFIQNQSNTLSLGFSATQNGQILHVSSSGNVGIGTTNPSYKLDVQTSDDIVASFVSTDNKAAIRINDDDTNVFVSAENARASFGFNVGTHANNLNILSSGNVGIGTTSPANLLHLYHATENVNLKVESGDVNVDVELKDNTSTSRVRNSNGKLILTADLNDEASSSYISLAVDNDEKVRISDGGNVGIGTTSPTYKLDVDGTGRFKGNVDIYKSNAKLTVESTGASEQASVDVKNTSLHARWILDADDLFRVYNQTSAFSAFAIKSSGNVGIGTTSPTYKLQVNHGTTSEYVTSFRNTADNLQLKIGTTTGALLNIQGATINSNAAYNIALQADGGKVGIGTTSPIRTLSVVSTDSSWDVASWKVNNGKQGNLYADTSGVGFYVGTSGFSTHVGSYFSEAAKSWDVRTNGAVRMMINSSGNVGVGTASPGAKLTAVATASGTAGVIQAKSTYASSSYFSAFRSAPSDGSTTANGGLWMGAISDDHATISSGAIYRSAGQWRPAGTTASVISMVGGSIDFRTNSGLTANTDFQPSSRLTITSTGNVGIGTSSPGTTLDVKSSINGINTIIQNDTHNAIVQILASVNAKNSELWFGDAADGDVGKIDYDHANNSMAFIANASERMRITSSGNVGIGTTSPSAKLNVVGTSIFSGVVRATTASWGNGGRNIISVSSDASDNNSGISFYDSAWQAHIDHAGGDLKFLTGGTTEAMRIYSNGNVGIGTSSPGQKLTVNGDIGITTSNRLFVNDIAAYTGSITLGPTGTSDLIFRTTNVERMRIKQGGNVLIGNTTDSGEMLQVYGDEKVTGYLHVDGDVGIGNDAPAYKLDVSGDINADGDFYQNGVQGATGTVNLALAGGGSVTLEINGGIITSIV